MFNLFVVPTGVHDLHQDRQEKHLKIELFSFSGRVRFCVTLEDTLILYIIFSVSPHTTQDNMSVHTKVRLVILGTFLFISFVLNECVST